MTWTAEIFWYAALPCFIAGIFAGLMGANILAIVKGRLTVRRIKKKAKEQYGIDLDKFEKDVKEAPSTHEGMKAQIQKDVSEHMKSLGVKKEDDDAAS